MPYDTLAPAGPYLLAWLLPPTSLIVLLLVGLRLVRPQAAIGIPLVLLACAGLWLSATPGLARALQSFVLKAPPALGPMDLDRWRAEARAAGRDGSAVAVLVLGGGLVPRSPDYRLSDLGPAGLERLRYGVWLSRALGAPLGFSGGVPREVAPDTTPEARVAERIVREEYGHRLRWVEDRARNTRESAALALPLLRASGVKTVLLVSHAWHLPRAQRAFREALGSAGIEIVPAPMGRLPAATSALSDWLPSEEGLRANRRIWREGLALLAGR